MICTITVCILYNSDYLLLGVTMDTKSTVASGNQLAITGEVGEFFLVFMLSDHVTSLNTHTW